MATWSASENNPLLSMFIIFLHLNYILWKHAKPKYIIFQAFSVEWWNISEGFFILLGFR